MKQHATHRKPRILALLLATTIAFALGGCGEKGELFTSQQRKESSVPHLELQEKEPFTYTEDIWSDRMRECVNTIKARIEGDVTDAGYSKPECVGDLFIYIQTTLEQGEDATRLVVRGAALKERDGEPRYHFTKLTYTLGESLAHVTELERWDEVQNAKFFVDIADNLSDLTLERVETNTQIDAAEFYEKYNHGVTLQLPTFSNEKLLVATYNTLYGTDYRILENLEAEKKKLPYLMNYSVNCENTITFVGEYTTTAEDDGKLRGNLPVDYVTINDSKGTWSELGARMETVKYVYGSWLIWRSSESELTAEEFVDLASYKLMDVDEISHTETEEVYACGHSEIEDAFVVLEHGRRLTGEEALKSVHDYNERRSDTYNIFPDTQIAIDELSDSEFELHLELNLKLMTGEYTPA